MSQINWEYLSPSTTHTGCPYKGEASYYNAVINGKEYKDVVWWYKSPIAESVLIAGMVSPVTSPRPPLFHSDKPKADAQVQLCFYPDKVDMWIDGKKADKTGMPFTTRKADDKAKENGGA